MNLILRTYQAELKARVRAAFAKGYRRVCLVLPPGGGKTAIFCSIAEDVDKRRKRAIILVHRRHLIHQAQRHLSEMGVKHGIIAPGYPMSNERIQIASVQTLKNRIADIERPDMIITDEAHHSTARTWDFVLNRWHCWQLGVTATPCRLDGRGLHTHYDFLTQGPTVNELIGLGYLVRPTVYAPPIRADLSGLHIRAGDYNEEEIAERMDKPQITGNAIEHYQRICLGTRAVTFCSTIEHGRHVAEAFNASGIPSALFAGDICRQERDAILAGLEKGTVRNLVSVEMISEGTDIPSVETAIMLRPTASLGLFIQQAGRAMRPAPGKKTAYILDHVGNCLRLKTLPTDDQFWTLDGDIKKEAKGKKLAIKVCPQCNAVVPINSPTCNSCGSVLVVPNAPINTVNGKLVEVESDGGMSRRALNKIYRKLEMYAWISD